MHNEGGRTHLTYESFADEGDAAVAAGDLPTAAPQGRLESAWAWRSGVRRAS